MRRAGVREARQGLTSLLDEVRKGREVVITDRGRPVARLAPRPLRAGFPDLSGFRRSLGLKNLDLTAAVIEDREDRV